MAQIIRDTTEIAYFSMGKPGTFKVICDGESASLGRGHMLPGDVQVPHRHMSEQMGYVESGSCELIVEGKSYIAEAGCTYHIPPYAEHEWRAFGNECFTYIDFFTPKRPDLLNGEFRPDLAAKKDNGEIIDFKAEWEKYRAEDHREIPVIRRVSEIPYFTQGNGGIVKVIVDGEAATMSMGHMVLGDDLPSHHHPNEQMGYVLSGAAELIVDDVTYTVKQGYIYHLPCNSWHTWKAVGNERFSYLDFFVPRRMDLVNGQFNFAKWTAKDPE